MILPASELMPLVQAALDRGQKVRLTACGGSMLPFIGGGDVVELEPAGGPAPGEAVLVRAAGPGGTNRYVLHYVARLEAGGQFFVRGAAQRHCEGPFPAGALLGRAARVWHNGRCRTLNKTAWRLAALAWLRSGALGLGLLWLALSLAGIRRRLPLPHGRQDPA